VTDPYVHLGPADRRPAARWSGAGHPLGPILYRIVPRRPVRARLISLLCFIGCAAVLVLAAWLEPDPSGLGSHEQLGFAPCTMFALTGYPCPTCGMSTAFAHTMRGQVGAAFHAQPAGFVLALATIVAAAVSLGVVLTGRVWALNWYRVSPARLVVGVMLLVAVGWGYKLTVGILSGTLPAGR